MCSSPVKLDHDAVDRLTIRDADWLRLRIASSPSLTGRIRTYSSLSDGAGGSFGGGWDSLGLDYHLKGFAGGGLGCTSRFGAFCT